jgi:hypothetical protein
MGGWVIGDSRDITVLVETIAADFVFSCPPYADLEVYSDDPRDLSTLDYDEFRKVHSQIIAAACSSWVTIASPASSWATCAIARDSVAISRAILLRRSRRRGFAFTMKPSW